FCADHDAIPTPPPCEEVADDLLGMAVGVDVGGVDEIAAALQIGGNHGFRVRDTSAPSQVFAKRHAPKAKWAHAQSGTAQRDEGIERHIDLLGCEEWRAVIRRFLFHRTIPETPGGRLKLPASCIILPKCAVSCIRPICCERGKLEIRCPSHEGIEDADRPPCGGAAS